MNHQEAMRLALEALQYPLETSSGAFNADKAELMSVRAIIALRAALAEPERKAKPITADEMSVWVKDTWEKCQAEAWQNPFGDDAERYARKLREEREVRNLANYEFKTYKTGGAELEAGFYSTNELRDLVKALDEMNAVTERSMRRMK